MKCFIPFLLSCCLLVSNYIAAQSDVATLHNTPAKQLLQQYLIQHSDLQAKSAAIDLKVSEDRLDKQSGLRTVRGLQKYNKLSVVGGMLSLHYNRAGELYAIDELIEPNINTTAPAFDATSAVKRTMDFYGLPKVMTLQVKEETFNPEGKVVFDRGMISASDIQARLVYYPNPNTGNLLLAWETQMHTLDRQHYYVSYIDALQGNLIDFKDKVLRCEFGGLESDASPEERAAHAAQHQALHLAAAADWDKMIAQKEHQHQTHFDANVLGFMPTEYTYTVLKEPGEAPNDLEAYDSEGGVDVVANPVTETNELPQMQVTTAGKANASPFGWHNLSPDGTEADLPYTHGNNVWAFHDPSPALLGGLPNPAPEYSAQQRMDGTYDYPWDLTQEPEFQSTADLTNLFPNRNAATTNLFYWNNLIHDVYFNFGLTEEGRNFQRNNYSGNGDGNDEVLAQSQDGGGTNNANFLTLQDGVNGQMQMYLWTASVLDRMVILEDGRDFPSIEGALYNAAMPAPGARVPGPEEDVDLVEFVLVNDGCAGTPANSTGSTGCGLGAGGAGLPPCNDVTGKIVLIDRGDCSFVEKAYGAQQGGAAGVIVMNNNQSNPDEVLAMGGTDPTANVINIPSVMVSFNSGVQLKALVAAGTLMGKLQRQLPLVPKKDGDFDNGIIAHEYGHGISNRLSPQDELGGTLGGDEQGGEGWSDYIALYMTTSDSDLLPATTEHPKGVLPDRGIGTYVFYTDYNGVGIRPRRYSTNESVNEYTFSGSTNGGKGIANAPEVVPPHGVGFVWCTMLWEMTQLLVDRYGISNEPDRLYIAPNNAAEIASKKADGMNVAMRLILKGIELQPQNPSFIQQRDAIIEADEQLFGGIHTCDIWKAFAKRGLGINAVDLTNGIGDERDGFGIPEMVMVDGQNVMCGAPQVFYDIKISAADILTDFNELTYTITVTNTSPTNSTATNVVVNDILPEHTSFVRATGPVTANTANSVTWMIPSLSPETPEELIVTVNVAVDDGTNIITEYDFESGSQDWTPTPGGFNEFTYHDDGANAHSGNGYYHADNFGFGESVTYLTSPTLPEETGRHMRFWHNYDLDRGDDGTFIEGTRDGGVSWERISSVQENPYTGSLDATFNPVGSGPAFTGLQAEYYESSAALDDEFTQIRFVLSEDVLFGGGEGWFVDDIKIVTNPVRIVNDISITDPEATGARTHSASTGTLILPGVRGPLAVDLVNLTATPLKDAIRLDWVTASEVNNKGFYVERLNADKQSWTTLGFVKGIGNTNAEQAYTFLDNTAKVNRLYTYRLRQIDNTGIEKLSNKVAALLESVLVSMDILPNPASTSAVVNLANVDKNSTLRLVSVTGQLVRTYPLSDALQQSITIDVEKLPAGIYMLQIPTDNGLLVEKLIVE